MLVLNIILSQSQFNLRVIDPIPSFLLLLMKQILILTLCQRRGPIAAEFAGPGPAAITLPTLFGSKFLSSHKTARNFSLFPPDPNIKESTKTKSPAFTMAGRIASKGSTNPSPNAYNTTGITVRGEQEKQLTRII